MARSLPTGTVTFLFTDIEGSTRLLDELGTERYAQALGEHRRVLRDAFGRHGGVEVDTQGDAFFVAFPTAPGALAAAADAQRALAEGPIRVRMGLHTGTPRVTDEGYVGEDVHRAARIAAAGHGGQVLVSGTTAALADRDDLVDLGEHRLKGLSTPERILQLGEDTFPPLKTLFQTNLPIPTTSFLGREREIAEVAGLLARPELRLVTLTGPAGTGKTRLSLAVANTAAERYPDGVWWVPLASIRDPTLVLSSAAHALGARDGLAEHIGVKHLLLLFDNFEQVVDAASDVAGLMSACPNLRLLVTSRERLRVTGEHEYPVPPMADDEAIELFTARAAAMRPDFVPGEAVAAICRRLDDLPLAIELAAARVNALSPVQIAQRLEQRLPLLTSGARDLPERQRTLRGAITWSYELLSPDEQRLFRRLSVFRGGCTLEAAEAVAGADLDTLASLVDKSLLRRRGERHRMLETIREFAAEQLEASGEADQLRGRHAEHFRVLAEEAEPHVRRDELPALEQLDAEHDNLRAALDWLEATGRTQVLLELAGALTRFWYLRGYLAEGGRRLSGALAADHTPTIARARALNGASVMAYNAGDHAAARGYAEQARDLFRTHGDPWGEAYASFMIANATAEGGDLAGARGLYEVAVEAFSRLGDEHMALIARSNLVRVIGDLGDRERERELLEENIELARRIGHERMEASSRAELGIWHALFSAEGDRFEQARDLLSEAIRIEHRRGDLYELAIDMGRLAFVHAHLGKPRAATRLVAGSEAVLRSIGGAAAWAEDRNRRTRDRCLTDLGQDEFERESAGGAAMSADELVALALEPDA